MSKTNSIFVGIKIGLDIGVIYKVGTEAEV